MNESSTEVEYLGRYRPFKFDQISQVWNCQDSFSLPLQQNTQHYPDPWNDLHDGREDVEDLRRPHAADMDNVRTDVPEIFQDIPLCFSPFKRKTLDYYI